MTFARTRDLDLVRRILTEDGIYPHIGDDFSPQVSGFQPNADERIWYVLAIHGFAVAGLFVFIPESPVCWQAHVAMRRKLSPLVTHQAGREIVAWIWEHTRCVRLIASVPASNRAAVRFGLKAMGLRAYGRNRASFLKHGQLWDQVLMGISRDN